MVDDSTPNDAPLYDNDPDDANAEKRAEANAEGPDGRPLAELPPIVHNTDRPAAERLAAHHALVCTEQDRFAGITSQADLEENGLPEVPGTLGRAAGTADTIHVTEVQEVTEDGTPRDGIHGPEIAELHIATAARCYNEDQLDALLADDHRPHNYDLTVWLSPTKARQLRDDLNALLANLVDAERDDHHEASPPPSTPDEPTGGDGHA